MKKQENALEITLHLPEDFQETLEEALESEFKTACRKWGLSLNTEAHDRVLAHARTQLEAKVTTLARHPWTMGESELVVVAATLKAGVFQLSLPSEHARDHAVSLVRSHDRWKVDQEPTGDAVLLEDFFEVFTGDVKQWARTAVFYGVGSYA